MAKKKVVKKSKVVASRKTSNARLSKGTKGKKNEHSHVVGKTCRACSISEPMYCPLCSKESLVLIGIAVVMIALGYAWSRYLAWAALILAFLVPVMKHYLKK